MLDMSTVAPILAEPLTPPAALLTPQNLKLMVVIGLHV